MEITIADKVALGMVRVSFACLIFWAGIGLAGRLQVYEHARIAVAGLPQAYEGRVSRNLITGDYVLEEADGTIRMFPNPEQVSLAWQGSSVTIASALAGLAGTLFAGLLLFLPELEKRLRRRTNPLKT